jgi:outer membrane lipoprotein-sorting protein
VTPARFAGIVGLATLAAVAAPNRSGGQTSTPPAPNAQSAADSLLDRAARFVASARPMRAAFEQTLYNPDIKQTKVSRGEFGQQGAARFAFRFTDPPGDAIVADGSAIWVYLPSASRGQALKLPIAQGAQLDLITQLLTAPRASYKITTGKPIELGGRPVVVVQLEPKVAGTPFTHATLWLDRDDALVRQLEAVEPSGLVRKIRFSEMRTDVELPAAMLTFTVPTGVKVLDASGLFGVKPPQR